MVRPHCTLSLQSVGEDRNAIFNFFGELFVRGPATIVVVMVAFARMALASVIAISLISASTEIGFAARVASWANAQEQPQTTASQTGSTAVPVAAPPGNSEVEERPLPDIPTLMRAVETNQRASEKIEKDYLYKSVQTERQSDGHGGVKKVEVKEYDVFLGGRGSGASDDQEEWEGVDRRGAEEGERRDRQRGCEGKGEAREGRCEGQRIKSARR